MGHAAAGGLPNRESSSDDTHSSIAGVQRALVESMLRLSCRDTVLTHVSASLVPVPDDQAHVYNLTLELYGTTRMLLACLTRSELAKVGLLWDTVNVLIRMS